MTDHLPECDRNLGSLVCICKQLRACEQRKDAEHVDCRCNELEAMAIVDGKYESVAINGQLLERRDVVLKEARDAVAALPTYGGPYSGYTVSKNRAVAAIDALLGDA